MNIFQSILLGIVQGLTEFIPVSSSAHLVIVPYLLNWKIPANQAFVFDVLVQVATLAAVFIYFWRDIVEIVKAMAQGLIHKAPFAAAPARLGWFLLLATVPAGLAGLLLKDAVEIAFGSPRVTALLLFVTAGLLVVAERVGKRTRELESLNWKDALWIGLFQAASIFPGVSRSGATITGGMTRDFQRPAAARFAFLMSIPIMLASGLLASLDLVGAPNFGASLLIFIPGLIVAAVIGYLAIRWLLRYLVQHTLYDFAIYCAVLGLITLVITFIRG
jgi:undecaprenyl-diphosphatase